MDYFEYLDLAELIAARDEARAEYDEGAMGGATYAGNAGPFVAPLGPVLTRVTPTLYGPEEIPDCEDGKECSLSLGGWGGLMDIGTGRDYGYGDKNR